MTGLDGDARGVLVCGQSGGRREDGGGRRLRCFSLVLQGGATPLLIASQEGHVEVVGALLAKGADVEAKYNVRTS